MTWLYLHLVTNHFPIILTLLGTIACLVGLIRGSQNAWYYGVVTLLLGAIGALPSWISGYQAHYVLETRLGLPEGIVEPHELLAEATMWIMIPLGVLAAFTWWRARQEPKRGPSPPWVRPVLTITAVMGSVMLGITAFLGGKISHSEAPRAATAKDSAAAAAQQNFQPLPTEPLRRPGTGDTAQSK